MKALHTYRALAFGAALLAVVSCTHRDDAKIPGLHPEDTPTVPGKPTTTTTQPGTGMATEPVTRAMPPGRRISRLAVPGNYVALTFDDGPSAANTPRVLDILRKHGAHGTFFVVGESVNRNAGILSRAVSEGNEIGVHTWSHIKMTGSSSERINSEVSRSINAITAATGRAPRLIRPPYGATNASIVNSMFENYGLTSVLWDVDTRDWQHPGVDVVISRAVGNAHSGSIILVHDIHASTLAALEGIVSGLQARGFKLVTVSELMALANHAAAAPAPVAAPAPTPAPTPVPAVAEPVTPNSPPAPVEVASAPAIPTPVNVPASNLVPRVMRNMGSATIGNAPAPAQEPVQPVAPAASGGASAISGQN
ncbi:MAG: polysaccharide deacetylase family protein [Akkermansia sp.]|nr:polysaccharide deacetylase family protein [Akkermansia sp.]